MIRIIAELRDGGIVRDLASGPIKGEELEMLIDLIEIFYKSRPFELRLEEDEVQQ